ncbi:MAG: hypothetical protein ACJATN_002437 [Neolewinella sp.]|jgi:hypothetical protein
MSINNPTTFLKHSLYWLLPVILLNVFTSVGLQANLVELPYQVQTEQLFGAEQPPALSFLAPAKGTVKLITLPIWSGLTTRSLPASTQVALPVVSVHPSANNTLRFYGKAAPEALDAWWGL